MGVQHALRQLLGIQFARVVEEKTTNYSSRLVAYVSPDTLDPREIKAELSQKVPKAMVPSLIIPIPKNRISFTSSGKLRIDQSKLIHKIPSPNYVSPSSDIEKQIVSLYQKCLGIENEVQFGMNDKFTDFGGDSVAAVHLANEVRLQLSWNVQPSDIVQLTPSELFAKYSPLHIPKKVVLHNLKSSNDKDAKYLPSVQKALLSMNKILLGPTYNIPITFQISGKTCGLHIASALEKVLPILRQAFWEDNTKKFPISYTEHVSHVDLCSLPLEAGQKSALKMVQKDAVCAVDLNKSPFRCTLYYLSSDCWILSLVIHHLVFDYASWGCLQQLIEYAYCHKSSDFQTYCVPFNDFLECDQQEYGKNSSQIVDFWTSHLKHCQLFIDFPTTFPRPRCQCYRGRRIPFTFDLSASAVVDFCEALEVDPLSFFLSTFAVLLYSISHKHSFGIGVTVGRRMTANMKRIVGLLVNTVLCCFPFDKLQDSFANLLQYVQAWHKEALSYSSVHFQDLVNFCVHNSPQAVHHTIPQFFFNYISKFQQPCFELGSDVDIDFLDIQTYTAKAELFLEVHSLGSSFQGTLEYNTALFSKSAMDNLISNYIQLIHHSLHNSYDTGFYQIFLTDMATQTSPTTKCEESTTHTILPLSGYQLSLYKEFIEMPIDLTAKFHATFSLKVASNTDIKQVQDALHAVAREYPYLKSSIFTDSSACACLKVQSVITYPVYYETVSSEIEFEAVKLREQQWPFDIFTPPLFHCLLINCSYSNSTELLLVVHQLLLNEVSIRLFARLLNASLTQNPFTVPDRPDSPSESTMDSDSALQYWIKCLGNVEQPFSFDTSEISQNSSIQEDCNIPFHSEKELQVLCCAFTSLFTWELQKTPHLQFCLLYPTSNKLQASECFIPMSVEINKSTSLHALYNSLHAYISETSLHPLPSYWRLQEQLNPFTSMLHPYHDILLQIFNLRHCSNELSHFFPRAFKVLLSFEPLEKKVTLTTYLNTQQTLLAHQCLKGLLSIFPTMLKAREVPISDWLPQINLPVSKCSGKVQDSEHSLKDMLQSVLSKFKFSIAYYDCIRANEAKIPCCVTYAEAFHHCHQLVSHINSVLSVIPSCDIHQIAILTSGGFEQPLATLAAVLSGHVFLMIDPTEEVSLLVEKLTLASVSLLLYDFKCLSVAEKVVSQLPQITTRIVDLYYEQWEDEQALLPLPSSNRSCDDENAMSETMFIVFTSGTAGKPKAIPVPEISFCNFLLWFNSILHSDHLRWIQFMYPCIDVYVAEIFTQLLHGNSLVLINSENKLNFFYTFNIMRSYGIQGIFIIPTVLTLLLNKTYHKDDRIFCWNSECLPHMRQVFSIGEILPKNTCTTFFQRFQLWVLLHNFGGPAECGVAYAHCTLNNQRCLEAIPMGHLVTNSEVCIINPHSLQPVPLGMLGEIVISGLPVFRGYIDGDAKSFFCDEVGKTWYRTGDIGYIDNLQQVVLLHRLDTQVKLHGQRISLSGIQEMIRHLNLPNLYDVIVDVIQKDNVLSLICFPIISGDTTDSEKEIQESFIKLLPKKYVPLVIQCYNSSTIPRLLSGKIDLKTLKKVATTKKTPSHTVAIAESIPVLHDCLTRILPYTKHMESTNWLNMSLDSLGLSSVHKAQLHQMLLDMDYQVKMSSILISQNFRDLARKMTNEQKKGSNLRKEPPNPLVGVSVLPDDRIAIIAMEVNVPGASTSEEFWGLISNGMESISHDLPCGTLLEPVYPNSHYVGSRGVIQNREMFDAQLFDVIDVDARFMDPQQRLLLHTVWTSLEKAGYDPTKFSENGKIGCFAGTQFPSYMLNCLKSRQNTDQIVWGSLRDNVALRIGKCLNFRGPCITIANNCATFAVALHLARCSLLRGECDLAVVAAASVSSEKTGYIAREGDIYSHDGHCRPFSKFASGTVMSDGIIVIVLRRLSDAEESGDEITCCVKISAVGSDGAQIKRKQYVPSVEGQADVLRIALRSIQPRTIAMIEAHGTGTRLGDEVELESLNSVFQELGNGDKDTCIIGSVKGNIGHLGIASAGAGIVKAALALKHAQLAPSINCNVPIPSMSKTPFAIIQKPQFWQSSGSHPRRALVHSIGVMGTNSTIILEEYKPPTIPRPEVTTMPSKGSIGYPVCISAKTPQSLLETCKVLAQYISQRAVSIVDVAYTLLIGRQFLSVRRAEVFHCVTDLSEWLTTSCCTKSNDEVSVCIAFSGQGALIERLLLSNFYKRFPSFKQTLDMYCDFLVQKYPSHDQVMEIKNFINNDINCSGKILANMKPTFYHPLIILSQLSLYHLLTDLGLIVDIVLGHSLGEYTAACVAGVFSPEEVLEIVYERALLIEKFVPKGKMISVQISAQELQANYISFTSSLKIACYNSTTQSVISGSPHDIECLKSSLDSDGIKYKVLPIEHPYHHPNLRSIQSKLEAVLKAIPSKEITMTFVTTLHDSCKVYHVGSILSPQYWIKQLDTPVDFIFAMKQLCSHHSECHQPGPLQVIECGMQPALSSFIVTNQPASVKCTTFTLKAPHKTSAISALATMWENGVNIKLHKLPFFTGAQKLTLPTYVFDTHPYWIAPDGAFTNSVPEKRDRHDTPVVQGWNFNEVTVEKALALIKSFTGPGYDQQFPPDSMFQTFIREKILEMSHFKIDINHLLQQNASPRVVAEYVASQLETHTSKSLCDSYQMVMCLSPGHKVTGNTPIFIVNAVAGQTYSFAPLALLLSQAYTVHGVYAPVTLMNRHSIEECASLFLCQMKKVQSIGPYIIGGFSFGAWVAHSIAVMLENLGECVSLLFMIDPLHLEDVRRFLDIAQSPKMFERTMLGEDYIISQHTNESVVADYAQKFQIQLKLLVQYNDTIKHVTCPTRILLASERIMSLDESNLMKPQTWDLVCFVEFLKVHKIPGKHSTCIASINCPHIVANLEILSCSVNVHYPIPIGSVSEVVGLWYLSELPWLGKSPVTTRKTSDGELLQQSRLLINSDGNYFCMIPKHVLEQALPRSDFELEKMESVVLNSSGTFSITSSESGEVTFSIAVSLTYPNMANCDVHARAVAVNSLLRLCIGKLYLLWCKV